MASGVAFSFNKQRASIALISISSFSLFCFAASLDPFLNLWDERFHALVAKNLVQHPFVPTLYDDPVLKMSYDRWDYFHIWLHKQPLFLWQMALSFKLFGYSEFALRLPSVILLTITVLGAFRVGKVLVNQKVGMLTSILIMSSFYLFELISGRGQIDHNDISFLAYTTLSIWSLVEYQNSKKNYWIVLIGLFSGMAILCKWLVGLLVYSGWLLLKAQKKEFKLKQWGDLLISLMITAAIAVPWQIYTMIRFPEEASSALSYNALHFSIPIEGHGGTYLFHFDHFNELYGEYALLLIIPGLISLYLTTAKKELAISLIGMGAIVYLFFTLAATKMTSFPLVASIPVYLSLSAFIYFIFNILTKKIHSRSTVQILFSGVLLLLLLWRFDFKSIKRNYTNETNRTSYREQMIEITEVYKSLKLPDNSVLFNARGHAVQGMFYLGIPVYNEIPTESQVLEIRAKGREVAVFKEDDVPLPEYLTQDNNVRILKCNFTSL
ncbi:MAG TPA: hypothetical protein DDX92_00280 [Flavobacteriales bacterium]|nr:hypothetical protein [Flavobacteriales bacterium]